ncbi:MAG: N-acetylglucosamine-6-phosphate deacetylase [Clostridia bacterium]|nr:N-acetylglucosamine-6-phosphate deacetylase [Clostridia bacterium]
MEINMTHIYKNADLFGKKVDIKCIDGKIAEIGEFSEDGTDLKGYKVFPGLIDIHSHGCIGYDTMDGNHLEQMSEYYAKNGTTSWLPTTMTMSMEDITRVVNADIPKNTPCNILGFHMEGPYISPKHKGAQNESFIKVPSTEEFSKLKNIKIVTVAPEVENAMDFIKNCGAVVSLGHTDCDYRCGTEAIENGASCLTHTFNAMPPLHHRNPGVIGAAIEKEIYVQVICDGLHIHKSVIKMLYKTFGADKMILISDSMCATGLKDGKYVFGGQDIVVKNSEARTMDGALAGSTTTLLNCVKKAIEFGIPESDAFKMASETPAKLLKLNKGRIEVGCDADFIVLDNNYNVIQTVVGGKSII